MNCLPVVPDLKTAILGIFRSLILSTIQQNEVKWNPVDLPHDLILDILSRLPVKSVCRFKCVCKSWFASIQQRKFIEMHKRHSEIIKLYKDDTKKYNMWDMCDGLVLEECLLTKQYSIRNPLTKEKMIIPHPHPRLRYMMLSYVGSCDGYKLVHVYSKSDTENGGCKILSLGVDLEWRSLDIPCLQSFSRGHGKENTFCRVVNQVFFLFRYFNKDPQLSEMIYIEMGSEQFGEMMNIPVPQQVLKSVLKKNVGLVHWKNTIAIAIADQMNNRELHLWVLEDYKRKKWADRQVVISLSFLEDNPWLEPPCPWYCVDVHGWLKYMHDEYTIRFNIHSKELRVGCASIKSSIVALPSGNHKQRFKASGN